MSEHPCLPPNRHIMTAPVDGDGAPRCVCCGYVEMPLSNPNSGALKSVARDSGVIGRRQWSCDCEDDRGMVLVAFGVCGWAGFVIGLVIGLWVKS